MTALLSLAPLLERFFTQRLIQQRQVSPHTISSYRGRQLIAVFAKAGDRRQCRGKSHPQYKGTDCGRGADHCYTPDVDLFYLCTRWLFVRQSNSGQQA